MKNGIVWQGYKLPVSVKRVEPVEKGQHYSNRHAELVSASNEFSALGDPETSSG